METVIVICLLIVIVLLAQDKIEPLKKISKTATQEKEIADLPDIMGTPKAVKSNAVPKNGDDNHTSEPEIDPDSLDIEYDVNETAGIQVPPEELDMVFSNMPNLKEEEDEWNGYSFSANDEDMTEGVTYKELNTVTMLLQKDKLELTQKETAVALVQKMQGTELFSLLENSIEGVSRKIAELLDSTLLSETENSSSTLRKSDLSNFDIGEFV